MWRDGSEKAIKLLRQYRRAPRSAVAAAGWQTAARHLLPRRTAAAWRRRTFILLQPLRRAMAAWWLAAAATAVKAQSAARLARGVSTLAGSSARHDIVISGRMFASRHQARKNRAEECAPFHAPLRATAQNSRDCAYCCTCCARRFMVAMPHYLCMHGMKYIKILSRTHFISQRVGAHGGMVLRWFIRQISGVASSRRACIFFTACRALPGIREKATRDALFSALPTSATSDENINYAAYALLCGGGGGGGGNVSNGAGVKRRRCRAAAGGGKGEMWRESNIDGSSLSARAWRNIHRNTARAHRSAARWLCAKRAIIAWRKYP